VRARGYITARSAGVFLALSVVSAAVALKARLAEGWFRHDDGSLAHMAERVLQGELPHRDFADLYTGLLSLANAALFAVLGEDMYTLRVPLFVLFLVFSACFYALARRFLNPGWSYVATLFAIGWSVPVYPAPMPSWYLLFLSTIGTYAVVRFFETDAKSWLLLGGLCGGTAVAIKIVGIWFVVAVVLALLLGPTTERAARGSQPPSRVQAVALIATALVAAGLVVAVLSGNLGAGEIGGLLIPIIVLCGAVGLVGVRVWRGEADARGGGSLGHVAWFMAAVLLPFVALAAPYLATGGFADLVKGVLVSPQSRFEFASFGMPNPATLLWAVPLVAAFAARRRVSERSRLVIDVTVTTVLLFAAVTASTWPSYQILWNTVRALAPVIVVIGAAVVVARRSPPADHNPLFSLYLLVGGFALLLQFPFAAPVYFCYVAPLMLLAALPVLKRLGGLTGLLPAALLVVLSVFGLRQLDSQTILTLGLAYHEQAPGVVLDDQRANIRVSPETKSAYDRVLRLLEHHEVAGRPIFAGPDAPEIYFLARATNVTPSILDFLESTGATRGDRLVQMLEAQNISVVVLNHRPLQSPRLDASTVQSIRAMYANAEHVGRFEVRWSNR
jgi:hypothetical protein